ncbi:hypothetical protein HS041_06600 [Planomonospora sp. ID67723]|uniref:hypothetical protein n=1 Tax=Planomonospora sp. ID67723 TaxID=2738134 RepID=UPI0018C37826|nr:hypothetical protein [Planomonospora sp. ID67723]MBG0827432.1 hypothetical protein [Planomonospora sp. ID67723]
MSLRTRSLVLALAALLLAGAAGGYTLWAAGRRDAATAAGAGPPDAVRGPVRLGGLMFLAAGAGPDNGHVAGEAGGSRTVAPQTCARFYAAAGTAVCLRAERGAVTRYHARILDRGLRETRSVELPGVPSRARVSAAGHLVAWTVFVSGDSYLTSGMSTRTGLLDTRTGEVVQSLERFALFREGRRVEEADLNYWGVTFARDEDTFYASASTGGVVHLVRGSVSAGRMEVLRENAECPSLSPDGTRVVYKKRTGDAAGPWRLHVLELGTGGERPLAETGNVDDQAAWLDSGTVMYAKVRGDSSDVWAVPADGTGRPRLLLRDAYSPAAVEDDG